MSQEEVDVLKRALAREKASRKAAEAILESKSAELYETTQQLKKLVKEKTSELQGVFENIVDAYVVMDLWGNVLKMNDAAISLLGYDNTEAEFNLLELADESEADNVMDGFESLIKEGSVTNFHVKINTKLNGPKLVHINASIILDENNKPIAAQGIVRDITDVKASAEKLAKSESRLASLIINLDSGVLLEDEDRKIVLTNKKFCKLFSIPVDPEVMKGQDCSNAANQSKGFFENEDEFVERIEEILRNKKVVLADELIMKSGKVLERDFIPIIKDDIYRGHLWTYRDITLESRYKEAIEAEKQKYSSIIANMNLGLVEVDVNDKILMVNQSFTKMTGYTREELIGTKGNDFLPIEEDKNLSIEKLQERQRDKTDSYELRIKNKKGELRYWLVSGAPNYDLEGNVVGSIGINFDITEIKSLQLQKENLLSELAKSNDELQEYAHIVSHDLKSPLRSIDALISWIKEDNKGKLDAVSLQNFDHIGTTLEKMEQLISDVLEYSSVGADHSEKLDVDTNVLIKELIGILYFPEHIGIRIVKKLPVVKGYKTKLQQLFQNLISNAIKFIDKDKGLIEIDYQSTNTHYQFSIKDNGIGIDKTYHDKIFKIFHSLNKSKESTGIGLSIVKKIVDLHDGKIWLESEPKVGTTFYFTLKK